MQTFICEGKLKKDDVVIFKDNNNSKILSFENKSNVLGNKIAVFDADDNLLFFIDEDVASEYNEIEIRKDSAVVAKLKKSNNLIHRELAIETDDNEYEFLAVLGVLIKNGKKAAVIRQIDGDEINLFDIDKIKSKSKEIREKRKQKIIQRVNIKPSDIEKLKAHQMEIKEKLESGINSQIDLDNIRKHNREMARHFDRDKLMDVYEDGFAVKTFDDEDIPFVLTLIYVTQLLSLR